MTNSFGAFERTRGIEVVEIPSEADAIITGTGEIWLKAYISANPKPSPYNRQPVYGGADEADRKLILHVAQKMAMR